MQRYLASDDSDLGNGGFGIRVEQLGAVTDNAAVLLVGAWLEAGDIDKRDQWNVECITEADESRSFY